MLGKKFLLLTLIVLISLLPSFSEDITREFTITAVLPNTSGEETYSISVVDIRDGTISNAINKGDGIDLGRAVDLITGYKDMFAIDYTSNSTGPVTITVTLSPARKEDVSSYIVYYYNCTPSMSISSHDLMMTPDTEWIKDGESHYCGYSFVLPTEQNDVKIESSDSINSYLFSVRKSYYRWTGDNYFVYGPESNEIINDGNTISRRLSFAFKFDYDSYVAATEATGVYFINVTIEVVAE